MTQPTGHHRRPKPTGSPHVFVEDRSVPADQQGRHACATCHCMGKPDDAHHTLPDVPAQAEHLRRYEGGSE